MHNYGVNTDFNASYEVVKVDEESRIVYGWGIVCTIDGEPYYDLQSDHISDEAMTKATTEFMRNCRVGKEMHKGDQKAVIVHSIPLTQELQKSLGMNFNMSGWLVGMAIEDDDMLSKFKQGTYKGFSIGGVCFEAEED